MRCIVHKLRRHPHVPNTLELTLPPHSKLQKTHIAAATKLPPNCYKFLYSPLTFTPRTSKTISSTAPHFEQAAIAEMSTHQKKKKKKKHYPTTTTLHSGKPTQLSTLPRLLGRLRKPQQQNTDPCHHPKYHSGATQQQNFKKTQTAAATKLPPNYKFPLLLTSLTTFDTPWNQSSYSSNKLRTLSKSPGPIKAAVLGRPTKQLRSLLDELLERGNILLPIARGGKKKSGLS